METCAHPAIEPRLRTKSNGTTSVTMQCLVCGLSRGDKPKAQFDLSKLKPFDEKLLTDYIEKQQQDWKAESEKQSEEWWTRYKVYLESDHWRQVRKLVLARDRICQVCFLNASTEAHHLCYDSFSKWNISFAVECVGICTDCHNNLHAT